MRFGKGGPHRPCLCTLACSSTGLDLETRSSWKFEPDRDVSGFPHPTSSSLCPWLCAVPFLQLWCCPPWASGSRVLPEQHIHRVGRGGSPSSSLWWWEHICYLEVVTVPRSWHVGSASGKMPRCCICPCWLCPQTLLAPVLPQHPGRCLFPAIRFCPASGFLLTPCEVIAVATSMFAFSRNCGVLCACPPPAPQIFPVEVVWGLLPPSSVLLVGSQPRDSFLVCSRCSG